MIILTGCARPGNISESPNLLFVFADQYRKQSIGFMQEDPVLTPALDQLAREGIAFTNAVSTCPICSPYRAMLMTGRFPLSTGITSNCMPGTDLELEENENCIGDILKSNGYHTGYIGKWHLEVPSLNRSPSPEDGAQDPWDGWTPPGTRRHGFDFWYAYNSNGRHFHPNYWSNPPERIDINQWSVAHETDVAIEFLKNRPKDKPFALFISWNPPHPPYVAPEPFLDLYRGKPLDPRPNVKVDERYLKRRAAYLAAVSSVDHHFGRLMEALKEAGLEENTLVVFTSDHGEMLGSHGRYAKSVWFDESIGIPFIIRWKGRLQTREEQMPFACYHFMPTLLGLMGIEIPESVEGTSYAGLVLGNSTSRAGSAVIAGYGNPAHLLAEGQEPSIWALQADSLHRSGIDWRKVGYRGLRTEKYTYVVDRGRKGRYLHRYLYDLDADPYQLNPIRAVHADENEIMRTLDIELKQWMDRMHDPFSLE
ncbi:MAG: sulfatase family protein [Bacteroidales bacterium]